MNFFDNLLMELAGQTYDSCGGDCYDSCSGVSQGVNDCLTDCTYGCTAEGESINGEGGGGGACLTCYNSCSGTCRLGCGALVCGTQCNSVSTSSK